MSKTWRELNAEGVKRCCAIFTDGHQCRRRAIGASWCATHGPIIKLYDEQFKAISEEMAQSADTIEDSDEHDEEIA